ncbi:hypothetical protein BDP27DRAFT_1331304 [Rhodocollybia butyracea]|uniref:DUF2470 domain-containing protein n=1 Tax=Rhodocollybia butyracea TaxID=206335 RepID=A0A9P5U4S7_9AGAR|nr:hypothetical protein BDP27DRAFT_1331304 [Rhodocollybia butyracea]
MAGDPVAEKSAFLRMYMSNHPDTLVAYAKWYGQVSKPIISAEMTAIDTIYFASMTLGCKMKDRKIKEVRVPIDPPMTGYDDVKPRLLEMKAIAQEGLGMAGIFIIHPVLAYFAYAPVNNPSPFVLPARMLATYLGSSVGYWIYWGMNVIHAFEAMYTWSLCRKHQTGFSVGTAYVFTTLICGYHIWKDLRKRIQGARIESVMKIE